MQTVKYTAADEQELMARLWSPQIKDDPLAFVMLCFPWGETGTPLERFSGPRRWQMGVLRSIAEHIKRNNGALTEEAYEILRDATSSGRGIGKSALVSWLVLWMLSTRIGSSTIVSANSETQLRSITWAEITKWLAMAINSHWFEISATRVMPAKWLTELVERDLRKGTRYWGAEGRLWTQENPDAYAGVHNYDGVMLIFDEASGIPDAIWDVAKGFFTELTPNRFHFAFSNPRRNSGYFYEVFHAKRDFWNTRFVDARTVEGTDKKAYADIIEEYGPDSPQAHVEVYGIFPNASDDQFIGTALVRDATERKPWRDASAPIVIGVDPARFGSDATVIAVRQGRDIIKIIRHRGDDTMETVGRVIEAIEEYRPALVAIDEGGLGAGVVDRLKEQRYKVRGVNFGNKARNQLAWGNKRAEMWGDMRDWLKTACIPNDRYLKADLTAPMTKPDSKGALFLESKKDMKARGVASPDCFVAGTMILTPQGERPIEVLRSGDWVCTPFGDTRVFAAWETQTDSLTHAIMSNGSSLTGTGKHKVFVWGQGEKRLDALSVTDMMEPSGTGRFEPCRWINMLNMAGSAIGFRQVVDITIQAGKLTPSGCFTVVFGQTLTALFQRASTFITKMATGATIDWKILSALMGKSIWQSIPANGYAAATSNHHQNTRLNEPQNGTPVKTGLNGTRSIAKNRGKRGHLKRQFADFVHPNIRRFFQSDLFIAPVRAVRRRCLRLGALLSECACGVIKALWGKNIAQTRVAPISVQTKSVDMTSVFNLTLENHNAYYANNILVFNCADAIALTFAFPVASRESRVDPRRGPVYADRVQASAGWMGN